MLLAIVLGFASIANLPPAFALFECAIAAGGLALVGIVSLRLRIRRTRSARSVDEPRVVMVGRPEPVLRALAAGDSVCGGRPDAVLCDHALEPGTRLRGLPVLDLLAFERLAERREMDRVVLVPPLSASMSQWVEARCRDAGLACGQIGEQVPSIASMRERASSCPASLVSRDVDPDAASRSSAARSGDIGAQSEFGERIASTITGRRVLLVGAAGSIGGELSRRVLSCSPASLLLADRDEDALAAVLRDRAAQVDGATVDARLLDVRDAGAVERCMRAYRPDIVLHVAGRRQVALAERHPADAALENLFGLRTLIESSLESDVERIVTLSSCAAVNPTSVLGAMQRLCERYVQATAARVGANRRLLVVRLPNLLGATGTVLPLFVSQIERGLPLTITHPDMERWFLTVPEAARFVLEALVLGSSGDILIPDPGRPVRVIDLAERLCAAAGLRLQSDVPVQFVGLRPGERLQEQMARPDEPVSRESTHAKLFAVRLGAATPIDDALDRLAEAALAGRDAAVVRVLRELVSEYRPSVEHDLRWAHDESDAGVPAFIHEPPKGIVAHGLAAGGQLAVRDRLVPLVRRCDPEGGRR
jgi:FlaA1/EpsC-like NDP-sugar epimerase